MSRFDVAIAGAGPAGGSLAIHLARRGLSVALIDRATFPRDKLCGEFLSPEAWSVLDLLGLAEGLVRCGFHPIRRARLTTPRGRVLEADLLGSDERPGLGLSRSALDEAIVASARELGATVFEGTQVGGPMLRDGRVIGLRARHPTEGPLDVQATVTVAADGRHSALVRQTGTTRGRSRGRHVGIKRHLWLADQDASEPWGTVGLHLVPGGYGGACRIDGGLTNFCALMPESTLRGQRGDLDRAARGFFGRNPVLARLLDAAEPAGAWKAVSGVRVEVSTPRVPGILYGGDCQGTVDPLGGQGMTMALLGADLLASFVVRAVSSERGADAVLQQECQSAWNRRFDRRVRLCRLFHHALIRPAWIDVASTFNRLAPRLLAAGFRLTRDPAWLPG